MTDAWSRLHIEVHDDEIIVALPLTSYRVAYYKPAKSPQLLARRIPNRDDPGAPIKLSDFLTLAWKAANIKARELGWIV
jgi:hypothetical protein